jgi:hypothetical protein
VDDVAPRDDAAPRDDVAPTDEEAAAGLGVEPAADEVGDQLAPVEVAPGRDEPEPTPTEVEPTDATVDESSLHAGAATFSEPRGADGAEPPSSTPAPEPAPDPAPDPAANPAPDPAANPAPDRVPVTADEEGTGDEQAPSLAWDPERYTTDIGEPDWYAEVEPRAEAGARPGRGEGSGEMEIATHGGGPETGRDRGADERFEEALAALDALAQSAAPSAPAPSVPVPPRSAEMPAPDPPTPPAAAGWTSPSTLRPTATPASRAYRRLRRIFPG